MARLESAIELEMLQIAVEADNLTSQIEPASWRSAAAVLVVNAQNNQIEELEAEFKEDNELYVVSWWGGKIV